MIIYRYTQNSLILLDNPNQQLVFKAILRNSILIISLYSKCMNSFLIFLIQSPYLVKSKNYKILINSKREILPLSLRYRLYYKIQVRAPIVFPFQRFQ